MRIQDICTSVKPNSCWIVGAATTIAVRSSDITKVIGPMRKNINRHRRPRVVVVTVGPPLPLRQHRERRGRWKGLSRCCAEARNGRCGRKLRSTLGPGDRKTGAGRNRNSRFGRASSTSRRSFMGIANGRRRPSADIQGERAWPFPTACLPCRIDFRPPVDFANEPEDESDFR